MPHLFQPRIWSFQSRNKDSSTHRVGQKDKYIGSGVWFLKILITRYMSKENLFHFSELQFLHLWNGDTGSTYLIGLWEGLGDIVYTNPQYILSDWCISASQKEELHLGMIAFLLHHCPWESSLRVAATTASLLQSSEQASGVQMETWPSAHLQSWPFLFWSKSIHHIKGNWILQRKCEYLGEHFFLKLL